MSENYTHKTFDCDYGRHALVYDDVEPGAMFGRTDVKHLLPEVDGRFIHATRMPNDYQPRHAA